MDSAEIYEANAHRCRALAAHHVEGLGRAALIDAAEQWELLAKIAKTHANPLYMSFALELPPPPRALIKSGLPAHSPEELHDCAMGKIAELSDLIARQQTVIGRFVENSEAADIARAVLESYVQLRSTLLKHVLTLNGEGDDGRRYSPSPTDSR